jgi:hypothetical protein
MPHPPQIVTVMWLQWLSLSLSHTCPLELLRERSYYQNLGQKMLLLTLGLAGEWGTGRGRHEGREPSGSWSKVA